MIEHIIELLVIILFIIVFIYKLYEYSKYRIKLWKVKKAHDIDFNNNVSHNIYWNKYKCNKCNNVILEKRSQSHEHSYNQRYDFNEYNNNIYICKNN